MSHTESTFGSTKPTSLRDASSSDGRSTWPLRESTTDGNISLPSGALVTTPIGDGARPPVHEPFLKRPFDILLAILGLVTSAPLWLVIAVAIKLEDRGPIFYVQERWGRGGRPFKVYKFRTMSANAAAEHGVKPANEKDHCVTRIGRVVRATGMDELPQFLCILKGDMSFVGPRALAVDGLVDDGNGNHKSYPERSTFH